MDSENNKLRIFLKKYRPYVLGGVVFAISVITFQFNVNKSSLELMSEHKSSGKQMEIGKVHSQIRKGDSNGPELGQNESYTLPGIQLFSDTPVGRVMKRTFVTMEDIGPDSEKNLRKNIRELRKNPGALLEESQRALALLDSESDYNMKNKIIFMLGAVGDKMFMPFLSKMATSERSHDRQMPSDPHASNPTRDELLHRLATISALTSVGSNDPAGGKEVLMYIMINETSPLLIRMAARSYLRLSDNVASDTAYLKSILPKEYESSITLKTTDVASVEFSIQ